LSCHLQEEEQQVAVRKQTHRRNIEEQLRQILHDTLNILVLLYEAMPLAVRNLTDDVESVKLQPPGEVAAVGVPGVEPLSLVEEELGRVVDKGLVLHERGHGKGRVDAAAELGVEVVVRGAEEGGEAGAADDGLLDDVEVGLGVEVC
jgi:hypothetical protein